MSSAPGQIVIFDGTCQFCAGSVQFILRHDRHGVFRFASRQSAAGRTLCQQYGVDPARPGSVVLIGPNGPRLHSDAVLGIAAGLGGGWRLFTVARVVPRSLRDWVYRLFARNRHRWFGHRPVCFVPSDAVRARFLE